MNLLKINTKTLKQKYPLLTTKDINQDDIYELFIRQNLTSPVIAEYMGTTKFIIDDRCKKYGYRKSQEQQKLARENTCLIKYGVKSVKQLKSTNDKYRETCLEKYGVDNISKTPERLQEQKEFSKIHGFQSDETNPGFQHDGKLSSLSPKCIKYKNINPTLVKENIEKVKSNISNTLKESENLSNKKEYWIRNGYNEDEAIKKVSDRQTTFSKNICIEKYGLDTGMEIWKKRQETWLNTISSKPKQEIERINRAKMTFCGYSKVSQKLFWKLYNNVNAKYDKIYFATLDQNTKKQTDKNNEYMIFANNRNNKNGCFFFDFFIKDIGKIIEFDGDYWHSEKRGNIERDRLRDEQIISLGYKLLHVRERDFKNNENKVFKECMDFLNE